MHLFAAKNIVTETAIGPIAARLAALPKPSPLVQAENALGALRQERATAMADYGATCEGIRAGNGATSDALLPHTKILTSIDKKIGCARETLQHERAKYLAAIENGTKEAVSMHLSAMQELLVSLEPDLAALLGTLRGAGLSVPRSIVSVHELVTDLRRIIKT